MQLFFCWLYVVGGKRFRVRALNLTVPVGSGQSISGSGRVRALNLTVPLGSGQTISCTGRVRASL